MTILTSEAGSVTVQTDTVKTQLNTYLYTFLAKKKIVSYQDHDTSRLKVLAHVSERGHCCTEATAPCWVTCLSLLPSVFPSSHRSRFTLESVYTACLLSRTLH